MASKAYGESAGIAPQLVVGLFTNANDAHEAITQLKANGYTSRQIGAAFRSKSAGEDRYANTTATGNAAYTQEHEGWWEKVKDAFRPEQHEAREDRAPLEETELNPGNEAYSRGEYEYDFAGDEFAGALAAAGIPAQRAAYLTRSLTPGGAIVTVQNAEGSQDAEAILSAHHGQVRYEEAIHDDDSVSAVPAASLSRRQAGDLEEEELLGENVQTAQDSLVAAPYEEDRTTVSPISSERSIAQPAGGAVDRLQLFGEVLRVHKERISRGEVRIHKDVITEEQTIEVPVTREELLLERVPVAGGTPVSSGSIGNGQEIRVPLSAETVRLEKQPVLREEVLVGKRDVSNVESLTDTVRHEELRVDSDVATPRQAVAGDDLPGEARQRN
jgi:uncharacterized protein (TIGR02271 family)